jgi:hypothetical protein
MLVGKVMKSQTEPSIGQLIELTSVHANAD